MRGTALRSFTQTEASMQESNSGRKKTYLLIMVILLVILAVTFF